MLTLELTENERLLVIFALGCVHNIPPLIANPSEPPASAIELAARLILRTGAPASAAPAPAAAAPPAKPPRPIPPEAKELCVTPNTIAKIGDGEKQRLVVEWNTNQALRVSAGKASCWISHKDLWPRLLEKVKQPVTILVVEKSGYLNIVGVK